MNATRLRFAFALAGVAAVPALVLASTLAGSHPAAAAHPVAAHPVAASAAAIAPTASSIRGLPGRLYYVTPDRRVVRLTPDGLRTVLTTGGDTAAVSPDGAHLAYLDGTRLVVTDADGHHGRTVLRHVSGPGFEPVWTADSRQVLIGVTRRNRDVIGIVDVAGGRFTPLPRQPADALHTLRAYGNGRLVYATGECRVGTADADGSHARLLPVLGVADPKVNPRYRRSCDPYSVSPDGRLVALDEHTGDGPDGDIGRGERANTIVDTRTALPVAQEVPGRLSAAAFLPDGRLLTRTTAGRTTTLTLLGTDGHVAARVSEPGVARDLGLLAYLPR